MKPVPLFALFAILATAISSTPQAALTASNLSSWPGLANLVQSRMTVNLGPQWIDVEEEAEIQVTPRATNAIGPWIVEGTFDLPEGSAIVGCMLWNGDTLLMGKLRAKADANKIFDSLVPPRAPAWPRDPLLVEQLSNTTYSMKLFPFSTNGTRRFRLRYLVPIVAGQNGLSVFPRMAAAVNGTRPTKFRLRLRGSGEQLKIERSGMLWPVESPSSELFDCAGSADVLLRWPESKSGVGVRGHQDSGAWKGDFVRYSGAFADSLVSRLYKRSETIVLWRWIQPRTTFFDNYSNSYYGTTNRYLSSQGYEALQQAEVLSSLSAKVVGDGSRIGMVLDEGLEDTTRTFPLGDSASTDYRKLHAFLDGLDETYLRGRVPELGSGNYGSGNPSLEASRSRQRFVTDIREVATLYSSDSGIVRHLVVVTSGLAAATGTLEEIDADLLPNGVTVSSSKLVGGGTEWVYENGSYKYVVQPPPDAAWPGVDLQGLVDARHATDDLEAWNGIVLPKGPRETYAARLSIASASSRISNAMLLHRDAQGHYRASLDVHGPSLGNSVRWTIYDEKGNDLSTWEETPAWSDVGRDSAFARLWAKSSAPLSPIFEDRDLGPIFGVVDRAYSLLATPSDTVGSARQHALSDSGVPFLTAAEIFARQSFGDEPAATVDDGPPVTLGVDASKRSASAMSLAWIAGTRTLRIGLTGLGARGLEIRDLRGRLLASFSASQLEGLTSLDWRVPANLGHGILLVSIHTASGPRTGRILVN